MAIEQTHRFRLALDLEANDAEAIAAKLYDLSWEINQGRLSRQGVSASPSVTCIHVYVDKEEPTASAPPATPVSDSPQGQL